MIEYHDKEWGVPVHNDRKHFEFMVLDAFQAGLSWAIVLKKREGFRKAFDNFEIETIARYDENKIQELLEDISIIRNRQKIRATINNAQRFLEIQKEFGSFDKYIWQFTDFKTKITEINPSSKLVSLISSIETNCLGWDNKISGYIAKEILDKNEPVFWYFDEYFNLPGRIDLNKVAANMVSEIDTLLKNSESINTMPSSNDTDDINIEEIENLNLNV